MIGGWRNKLDGIKIKNFMKGFENNVIAEAIAKLYGNGNDLDHRTTGHKQILEMVKELDNVLPVDKIGVNAGYISRDWRWKTPEYKPKSEYSLSYDMLELYAHRINGERIEITFDDVKNRIDVRGDKGYKNQFNYIDTDSKKACESLKKWFKEVFNDIPEPEYELIMIFIKKN